MGMLNLYDWGLPNQAEYLARYKDNEPLYNMARGLWTDLNSASLYFLITAIVVAIVAVCYYYYGYNKLPGRKYRVSHWAIWIGITAASAIILFKYIIYHHLIKIICILFLILIFFDFSFPE